MSQTVTQENPVDTFVSEATPSEINQFVATLDVQDDTGQERIAFLSYPWRYPPAGSLVVSAVLRLKLLTDVVGTAEFRVKRIDAAWLAATTNYTHQPSTNATNEAVESVTDAEAGAFVEIDCTDLFQDAVDGASLFGLAVTTDSADLVSFASAELSSGRPRLIVVYSLAPNPPTQLVPADGQQVSVALPTQSWLTTDPDGDPIAAFQYQQTTEEDPDFLDVELDTGWVTSTLSRAVLADLWPTVHIDTDTDGDGVSVNEVQSLWIDNPLAMLGYFPLTTPTDEVVQVPFDVDAAGLEALLEATSLTAVSVTGTGIEADPFLITFEDDFDDLDEMTYQRGLANTDQRLWRVRVREFSGFASGWSEAAAFGRTNKGTFTLDEPVDETLEVGLQVAHTLTGADQATSEYVLYREVDGAWVQVYRRAPLATDEEAFQLPVGYVDRYGAAFKIAAKVTDVVNRADTPGDPSYYLAEEEFTLEIGDTPPEPVDDLQVVAAPAAAGVVASFARDPEPDFFALLIDDVIVLPRVTPVPVDDGYQIAYHAPPKGSHAYAVQAVELESGIYRHSTYEAEAFSYHVAGLWIVAPDGQAVEVLNHNVSVPTFWGGVSYDIPDRSDLVEIVDTLGGHRGTITGQIVGPEDYAKWLEFRELAADDAEFRYIHAGDLNIAVRLGEVTVSPTDDETVWAVSFRLSQIIR